MNFMSNLFGLVCCLIFLIGSISDVSCLSDFENLSYGRDVLYGGVQPQPFPAPTQPPTESTTSTTKKPGFFSGIKNFFIKPTEAPIDISTSTTTIPVQPPLSPKAHHPPTGTSTLSRDFVNPNVKPGLNPVRPHETSPTTSTTTSTNSPAAPGRDYVNPNINPVRPPIAHPKPTPTTQQSIGVNDPASVNPTSTSTVIPNNRRDYVVPIRPVSPSQPGSNPNINLSSTSTSTILPTPSNPRRDYVNPNLPTYSNTPVSQQHPPNVGNTHSSSNPSNRRDYVNPNLPNHSNTPVSQQHPPNVGNIHPNNRRDHVNPNLPTPNHSNTPISPQHPPNVGNVHPSNRRDYVNPNLPTPNTPVSPQHPPNVGNSHPNNRSGGHKNPSNSHDFPSLAPPRKPAQNEDFPSLQPPRKPAIGPNNGPITPPNSVWIRPGNGPSTPPSVNFIPHHPTPSHAGSNSHNQLATDEEISTLTETLLSKDTNNQNKHVRLNLQGRTRSTERTDEAPNKLMEVDEVALQSPTISKMRLLFNNYELDTLVNEYVTPNERKEENDFLDAVMSTQVMRHAMQFLQNKGIVTPDPRTHRELVKTIWFTLYSRGQGRIGSSAFEHVFLSEIKNNTVIGLHNWVYYNDIEKSGHIDYKGYIKKLDLGNKGAIIKYRFDMDGIQKPVNTLFVGTSPELEMALYTVCFELRPDKDCPISLNGKKLFIVTHSWRYRGKSLIGSAFPEI